MRLLLNAIRCLSCNEIIASGHRHDFKTCKCGKVSVDGGNEYTRRVGKLELVEERCAWARSPNSKLGEAAGKFIVFSPEGKTNPSVVFDHKEDAELSAKDMATKFPSGDWFIGQLSHIKP